MMSGNSAVLSVLLQLVLYFRRKNISVSTPLEALVHLSQLNNNSDNVYPESRIEARMGRVTRVLSQARDST